MATPNYSYEKRQRELAKKKQKEEKRLRKVNTKPDGSPADEGEVDAEGAPTGEATPPPEGPAT